LIVETVAKIRRAHFIQKKSIKEICREFHLSRKVVRKVIRSDATEFRYERGQGRQPFPRVGPWREQLEALLLENAGKPRRERLTLVRVFAQLQGLGYGGSYDAIRRYARAWQVARGAATAEAFVPLSFAPGEAYQFDWSHEIVGVTTTSRWRISACATAGWPLCGPIRAKARRWCSTRTAAPSSFLRGPAHAGSTTT
jgi:hypothetical protein